MKPELAEIGDIRQLAIHHRNMFEEIWEQKGLLLEEAKALELEKAYFEKLEKQISEGICKAWVVKKNGHILASGAITIISLVPVPNDINSNIAYMHSVYTEREFRGRKHARQIIERAIDYCRGNGIKRVLFNASDEGKPIYEKCGFVSVAETMRLFIE